jgi:hypothetical protein
MISGLKKHWIPGQARNDEQGYGASVNLHHFVPGMSDLFGEFIFMNQSAKIITRNALETELMQVRASGKKIVFTNALIFCIWGMCAILLRLNPTGMFWWWD